MTVQRPRVVLIVLNWEGADDTIECLESLSRLSYPRYRVLVLDNGSADGSAEKIRAYAWGQVAVHSTCITCVTPNKLTPLIEVPLDANGVSSAFEGSGTDLASMGSLVLLLSPVNLGFAGGNNVAIRFALQHEQPDFIILLNNDTVADPEFVSELVRVAESDPSIGAVGARLLWYEKGGRRDVVQFAGGLVDLGHYPGYFPYVDFSCSGEYPGDVIRSDYASGAALLMKPKTAPFVCLDKTYFFGCEDVDYCMRLASKGFKTVVAWKATVWHKGGSARRRRFSGRVLNRVFADIATNLRFLSVHQPRWFFRLPVYLVEIAFVHCLHGNGERLARWRGKRHGSSALSR